jgi:hypothetical protein
MSTIKANAIIDAAGGNTATINGITPAFSSEAQAIAGTDNTTMMTPLRVSQGITTSPVLAAIAGASATSVGTYMTAVVAIGTAYTIGATVSGSLLNPAGSYIYDATSGSPQTQTVGAAQTGTWRLMGGCGYIYGQISTLWLRIS